MPSLNFYVSATEGRYGVRSPQNLANGQTFGSQGATVCVILLLTKANGDLFCGHMACGIQGLPGNRQLIQQRVAQLLDAALGAANQGQAWRLTGSANDNTNTWIREAMHAWFNNPPAEESNANTDGYFRNDNGNIAVMLSNDMDENGAVEVNSGPFSIEP